VALEHLSLWLEGKYEEYEKNPPMSCKGPFNQILVPINRSTYSQSGVKSAVIPKETIFTDEFVFDFFFYERTAKAVSAEGLLCLVAGFSNSRGDAKEVSVPIGLVRINLVRPDTLALNFVTDPFKQLRALAAIF
jgi:hypothetical protein